MRDFVWQQPTDFVYSVNEQSHVRVTLREAMILHWSYWITAAATFRRQSVCFEEVRNIAAFMWRWGPINAIIFFNAAFLKVYAVIRKKNAVAIWSCYLQSFFIIKNTLLQLAYCYQFQHLVFCRHSPLLSPLGGGSVKFRIAWDIPQPVFACGNVLWIRQTIHFWIIIFRFYLAPSEIVAAFFRRIRSDVTSRPFQSAGQS